MAVSETKKTRSELENISIQIRLRKKIPDEAKVIDYIMRKFGQRSGEEKKRFLEGMKQYMAEYPLTDEEMATEIVETPAKQPAKVSTKPAKVPEPEPEVKQPDPIPESKKEPEIEEPVEDQMSIPDVESEQEEVERKPIRAIPLTGLIKK